MCFSPEGKRFSNPEGKPELTPHLQTQYRCLPRKTCAGRGMAPPHQEGTRVTVVNRPRCGVGGPTPARGIKKRGKMQVRKWRETRGWGTWELLGAIRGQGQPKKKGKKTKPYVQYANARTGFNQYSKGCLGVRYWFEKGFERGGGPLKSG